MKKSLVVDLFAGVGGLSYGFAHSEKFRIVAANEILPAMAQAYRLNHPDVAMFETDIAKLDARQVLEIAGDEQIDILVGGPPCQAYSTVGKRLIDDPRGKLFQEYFRLLSELKPSLFVFENVKGLLSMQGGELLNTIIELFESLGYHTQYKVLNAAEFGAPQIRERVIIVGTIENRPFDFPTPTHFDPRFPPISNEGLQPFLTLGDALGDLPPVDNGGSSTQYRSVPQNGFQALMRANAPTSIRDHSSGLNNPRLRELIALLPEGGGPKDLPDYIRPKSGFANTYCRLWWDRPSTTITRNLGTPSSSRCIHPLENRALTTREGARLQCFPDDYVFFGSRSEKNLQIGNAVPTFLSNAMRDSIQDYLNL